MLINKIFQYFKDYLILFFFGAFIFLFSLKFSFIEFRYFILFLLFPCSFFFFQDIKNKNFNFIKYLIYILLFLSIHLFLIFYFESLIVNSYQILSLIYLLGIFTIAYYFFNFLNKNIYKLILIFIILFLISSFTSLINFQFDAPYFCGGIPDFFNIINYEHINPDLSKNSLRISFKEYIFQENSHLGMIAPSLIIFLIYWLYKNNTNLTEKFLIISFIIVCFIKSSTTLILGLFLSLILILLFNYKELSKKNIFSFFLILLICASTLIFNSECKQRFVSLDKKVNLTFDQNSKLNDTPETKNNINNDNEFFNFFKNNSSENPVLTRAVHFHALSIMSKSIVEKPFGWGLNRYINAFEYFNQKYEPKKKNLMDYNKKDGTNNLVKIVVEFGIFSFIFYIFVFLFIINKKIPIELKLFYFPIIITQSLRGAGYFNGGFILIAFLMLFTYIKVYKKLR